MTLGELKKDLKDYDSSQWVTKKCKFLKQYSGPELLIVTLTRRPSILLCCITVQDVYWLVYSTSVTVLRLVIGHEHTMHCITIEGVWILKVNRWRFLPPCIKLHIIGYFNQLRVIMNLNTAWAWYMWIAPWGWTFLTIRQTIWLAWSHYLSCLCYEKFILQCLNLFRCVSVLIN